MSKHSLVCTFPQTQDDSGQVGGGGEGGELNRRLEEVQGMAGKMAEENNRVGQIIGWKEMKRSCGLTVNELAGMGEMARGKVEQLTEDISLLVERRNTILMSNN